MVLIKSSGGCSFCFDLLVRYFSMVVKYLKNSYVGDPQNETMGHIGMLGLRSFGSPYSFGGILYHIAEHHRPTKHKIDWDSAECVTYSTN